MESLRDEEGATGTAVSLAPHRRRLVFDDEQSRRMRMIRRLSPLRKVHEGVAFSTGLDSRTTGWSAELPPRVSRSSTRVTEHLSV